MYYQAKVQFQIEDNGKIKNQNSSFLVRATSIVEAEQLIVKFVEKKGLEFEVKGIVASNIEDVLL